MEPEPLTLHRVIGLTCLSNGSFLSSPEGHVLYAAGCVCVMYNPQTNKQVGFFVVSKAISCICLSESGDYLAIGERGHQPNVTIWNVKNQKKIRSYSGHQHGIRCIQFSPNDKYLVSIGFKHDKQLMLHEWEIDRLVCVETLENKVNALSFHSSGEFFVTCGDKHLKWWYFVNDSNEDVVIGLNGRPASILKAQQDANFVDVICCSKKIGGGDTSKIFCITENGMLCLIHEKRLMDKWVQLDTPSSFCLTLTSTLLLVGGCEGSVLVFNPSTLEYINTLPRALPQQTEEKKFADCYGLVALPCTTCVAAMYADRSIFIWDIVDIKNPIKYKSFVFHKTCIWDIVFIDSTTKNDDIATEDPYMNSLTQSPSGGCFPPGTFATCSGDNSICIWNLDPVLQRKSKWKSSYSRDLLHCLPLDSSSSWNNLSSGSGQPDIELPDRQQGDCVARSLAIHPNGCELACGDKQGRLHVYNLKTMEDIMKAKNNTRNSTTAGCNAHEAEILTLNYSPYYRSHDEAGPSNMVLLASAGRDRLIHVFDATEDSSGNKIMNRYEHVGTLDSHSSSVTVVKFSLDGKSLISCGGDKTMVLHSVTDKEVKRKKCVQTPNGTINGLALDVATNKYAVSTGQNKRVNVWNLATGKLLRSYRPSDLGGELYKCSMDPSGTFIATCSFDKMIRVFDFFSGELVAQASGHSDLITGVKFSPDGKSLVSIGGDGCIMMWSLPRGMVQEMEDRLLELLSQAEKKAAKVNEKARLVATGQLETSTKHEVVSSSGDEASSLVTDKRNISIRTGGGSLLSSGLPDNATDRVSQKRPVTSASRNDTKPASSTSSTRPATSAGPSTSHENPSGKLFGGRRPAAPAWAMRKGSAGTKSSSDSEGTSASVGVPQGRWAVRAEGGPLQILGKPIQSNKSSNRHKLTLEMTVDEKTWKPPQSPQSVLAQTVEDTDEVLLQDSGSDSSDVDDSVEGAVDVDEGSEDDDLNKTSTQLNALEESALELESWLERKLKEEVDLDENSAALVKADCKVIKKPSDRPAKGTSRAMLGESLSSTFFLHMDDKVHPQGEKPQASASSRGDDVLPPPPLDQKEPISSLPQSSSDALFQKRQETACAVAQMRERLRQMGVLDKTMKQGEDRCNSRPVKETTDAIPQQDEGEGENKHDRAPANEGNVSTPQQPSAFLPPPPPCETTPAPRDDHQPEMDEDNDTASTASGGSGVENETTEKVLQETANVAELNDDEETEMRELLQNLNDAAEKARKAYSSLVAKKNQALSSSIHSVSESTKPSDAMKMAPEASSSSLNSGLTPPAASMSPVSSKGSARKGRHQAWGAETSHSAMSESSTLDSLLLEYEHSFENMMKSTSEIVSRENGMYRSSILSNNSSIFGTSKHSSLPPVHEAQHQESISTEGVSVLEPHSTSKESMMNIDDSANIEAVLEKYSDKLASMVSAKMLSSSQQQDARTEK